MAKFGKTRIPPYRKGEEVRSYASFHKKVGAALKTFSNEIPQRLRDS